MNRRRVALRATECALALAVTVVLPLTATSPTVYLASAGPCIAAAVVCGYVDARQKRH